MRVSRGREGDTHGVEKPRQGADDNLGGWRWLLVSCPLHQPCVSSKTRVENPWLWGGGCRGCRGASGG